jgi:hypothetical protein
MGRLMSDTRILSTLFMVSSGLVIKIDDAACPKAEAMG